jgi:hypothetical protein
MASNSFALKTLSVTVAAGLLALVGSVQKPTPLYMLAGILALAVFWWMDARYMHLESLFRALFEDVRLGLDVGPFDMNVERYRATAKPTPRIALRGPSIPSIRPCSRSCW